LHAPGYNWCRIDNQVLAKEQNTLPKTMGKADIMAIATLLKFMLALVGIILTFVFVITGLIRKDDRKLKRGGLIFIGTCVLIIVLATIEFLILT
jgi:hypothetical protein